MSSNNAAADTKDSSSSYRRSSQEGTMFSGLANQKRNSGDASAARRQSFADQAPKPGVIGQMWNNFTKGTDPK